MFGYPKWRAWTVIVISLLGVFFCIPNFIPSDIYQEKVPKSMQEWWRPMPLGLDLQGGSHLLLEIKIGDLVNERLNSLADGTRSSLRESRIKFSGLGVEDGVMKLKVLDTTELMNVQGTISKLEEGLTFKVDGNEMQVQFSEEALNKMKTEAVTQSIEIVRRRIDELGTKEPSIQRQGADRIVLQLPGVQDPGQVKAILGKTAKMAFPKFNPVCDFERFNRGTVKCHNTIVIMPIPQYIATERAFTLSAVSLNKI